MIIHSRVFSKYTTCFKKAPWFKCELCGFSYNIDSDIIERIADDRVLMLYSKRLVKKGFVMHICSHLIGDEVIFPDPDLDDTPVEFGKELYLSVNVKWFRELDVPTLYSIRGDARDRVHLTLIRERQIRIPNHYNAVRAEYKRVCHLCGRCINELMLKGALHINPLPLFTEGTWVPSPGDIIPKHVPEIRRPHSESCLKPWKDPESLFCDTKFLTQLLGKEPRKGDECRDGEEK